MAAVSNALPQKLRERRIALGFTLRDVEEITKGRVSNAYLSQIENGKIHNPSFAVVCELGAAYVLPIDTIREWLGIEVETRAPVICPTCGQAIKDHPHVTP